MAGFEATVVREVQRALEPLRDEANATAMTAYLKGIAPHLGVKAPERRAAVKPVFRSLSEPSSAQLGRAARALFELPEREYAHSACDMLHFFIGRANARFLSAHVERLLTTKPWWDTVDALGTAAVSPLTLVHPSRDVIEEWIASPNRWLVRAAIQHQRGRRKATEVAYVLDLCARHSASREFFITKAVGWALRDIAAFDKPSVRAYLRAHPELHSVSVREARRGLDR